MIYLACLKDRPQAQLGIVACHHLSAFEKVVVFAMFGFNDMLKGDPDFTAIGLPRI